MNNYEKYFDNPKFYSFVSDAFDKVSQDATLEELIEFTFGDMEEAAKQFDEENSK